MSRVSKLLAEYREVVEAIKDLREEVGLDKLEAERDGLKEMIDKIIVEQRVEYETDEIRIVPVQGFRRKWNVDKLEKIMPRPLFRRVIKVEIDSAKLDALVRGGKIDSKKIEPAFEETPNAPYAKWTTKSAKKDGSTEAASLAEQLA